MKISILCSDDRHPVNQYLYSWVSEQSNSHHIEIIRQKGDLSGGDILFLISCSEIVGTAERAAYRMSLVLHASDLPKGRGWSPHIWEIIGGAEEITLSLIEAADKIDNGRVWKKIKFSVPKSALWDEINRSLFQAEIDLMNFAVREFENIQLVDQDINITPSYHPRRVPTDSRLNPQQSIASQFDKIRVCDPERYPAYFELYGRKYRLVLERVDD